MKVNSAKRAGDDPSTRILRDGWEGVEEKSDDWTRNVHLGGRHLEFPPILLIGLGLGGVVLVMEPAGEEAAVVAGDPEVGRAGIEDHVEGLAPDRHRAVELGVLVVVDQHIMGA